MFVALRLRSTICIQRVHLSALLLKFQTLRQLCDAPFAAELLRWRVHLTGNSRRVASLDVLKVVQTDRHQN